jgi:hydrogenase/urease accessory protein HupE
MVAYSSGALAHEARPAYLELTETQPDRYDVVWRTPVSAGLRLPVVLQLPGGVTTVVEPRLRELADSVVERRIVDVPGGLGGKRIEFVGLQATITDVLVRVQTRDGARWTTLVHPSRPWLEVALARGSFAVAGAYVAHGIEHILLGFDHLLFVLALILMVPNLRVLIATVTAFTVAHSITLALATLGLVRVPGPPVEAAIALSILLLASEIARTSAGQPSLTARWPWLVAFSFGLLHGFGFASALSEFGLPRDDIPLALFTFNLGVEIGQLAFIAVVLASLAAVRRFPAPHRLARRTRLMATYAIGTLAAFWFVERLAGFA